MVIKKVMQCFATDHHRRIRLVCYLTSVKLLSFNQGMCICLDPGNRIMSYPTPCGPMLLLLLLLL